MENHYFDENGAYTGSAPANDGTVAPENALRLPPPRQDGYWPVLNSSCDGWELMEDHRGLRGWIDGRYGVVTTLGPLPDDWREDTPEEEEQASIEQQRQSAYGALADPLRDLAVSYRIEAEAWRNRGNAAMAKKAWEKYRSRLDGYLSAKESIRSQFPKNAPDCPGSDTGPDANPESPLFFVKRSGICHAAACGFARGDGEWLDSGAIAARSRPVRPCRRCKPSFGQ